MTTHLKPRAATAPLATSRRALLGLMFPCSILGIGAASAATVAPPTELPVYKVVQEGLTIDAAQALAKAAGLEGAALRPDGSFAFADGAQLGVVPSKPGEASKDEDGHETQAQVLDMEALQKIVPLADGAAQEKAKALLAPFAKGYALKPVLGHTSVDIMDRAGKPTYQGNLDTSVSYRLYLAPARGLSVPVVGPGASMRVAFAGDGSVIQLSHAVRQVALADKVKIISPEEAMQQCASLYGPRVKQGRPLLAYFSPALGAQEASGKGQVQLLAPHYVCAPSGVQADGNPLLGGRMVPAAPSLAPTVQFTAESDGRTMTGKAAVAGGTAPFTYRWSSSSTRLAEATGEAVSYRMQLRSKRAEILTLQVTDANGLASTASLQLPGAIGKGEAQGVPGGLGGTFGSVGIEQTVDEWACAQASADGFRSVMLSQGQSVKFDWRGASAWEKDFKKTVLGGQDDRYVDAVDAQWYTGHGSPSGFTFKSAVTDTQIVPSDGEWGNDYNLEWMQLESCQVLKDTTGTLDFFARWAPVFNGLHLLNGFHTNAHCIGGGTGGRFASYLFPQKLLGVTIRPALTVRQAWAAMAYDLEPAGVRFRTISPVSSGVHNLNDYYWGQGPVGPDIPAGAITGWIAISGTV